jgi:hypothetical protein
MIHLDSVMKEVKDICTIFMMYFIQFQSIK